MSVANLVFEPLREQVLRNLTFTVLNETECGNLPPSLVSNDAELGPYEVETKVGNDTITTESWFFNRSASIALPLTLTLTLTLQ